VHARFGGGKSKKYQERQLVGFLSYKVHVSKTCEKESPHLITHVTTTAATTTDEAVTETIHAELEQTDLTPGQHLLDSGYITAPILVSSQHQYGIEVIGPGRPDVKWQANTEDGSDVSQSADPLYPLRKEVQTANHHGTTTSPT
jgi:transposase